VKTASYFRSIKYFSYYRVFYELSYITNFWTSSHQTLNPLINFTPKEDNYFYVGGGPKGKRDKHLPQGFTGINANPGVYVFLFY